MTTEATIEVHHLLEGPEDAPMLVMANSSFACPALADGVACLTQKSAAPYTPLQNHARSSREEWERETMRIRVTCRAAHLQWKQIYWLTYAISAAFVIDS